MILRAALLAALWAMPVSAEELFREGTVLCSNYDARTHSCRTITRVDRVADGKRYATTRRMIALPEENLLLITKEVARLDGDRVCGAGSTAEPEFVPDTSRYKPMLLGVYKSRRDQNIARGVCHVYRPCGEGWSVFVYDKENRSPKMVSWTRIFGPDDAQRLGLDLRYREFGINERNPKRCGPVG